ncbi:efflux RND transporter periplasmic adaptor subunit [Duganella hordei]|uniref:efflux RND transporter periplasmic adaptor subunit n=1 Tax=Duganella hordei TaxID=2865934 RepID=UPI0030E998DD
MDRHQKLATAGVVAIAAIIGGAMLVYGAPAQGGAAGAPPPAAEIEAAQAVGSTITDYQGYSGRLEAIDKVEIRPLVGGAIVAVHFKDGALVKKGEPLFDIDPRPYQAEVNRAAAQVALAKANERYTSTDAGRAQNLLGDNAIAKRDYDQTQNAASAATASLQAAQAALDAARINLMYAHIVAPVSGRMSRAELTVGNVVSAGPGAPLLGTVVSLSPVYAAFEVDEQTYLRYLSHSGKAVVPVALGLADESGYSRNGSVDSIDNRLDQRSGTIRVRARFDNADGVLLPGLYARIKVGGGAPHAAVLVDDAAIGTDQEKKFVMVVDAASRAQYREIEPGPLYNGQRIVTRGLKPGERIVVNGLQRVRPNDLVKVKAVPMPGAGKADTRTGT